MKRLNHLSVSIVAPETQGGVKRVTAGPPFAFALCPVHGIVDTMYKHQSIIAYPAERGLCSAYENHDRG